MKKSKPPRRPTGDYLVGNCRPPVETRFKPGQSGHPAGRPKKTLTGAEIAAELLQEKVSVTENGKKRKISSEEVILRAMRAKAMKGDLKAGDSLFRLAQQTLQPTASAVDGEVVLLEDEKLFEDFKRDLALGEPASLKPTEKVEAGDLSASAGQEAHTAVDLQESLDDRSGSGTQAVFASAPTPVALSNPDPPVSTLDSRTLHDLLTTFGPLTSDK
jgi:hypothetical protein